MKALSESRSAHAQRAGLILLFDGEVGGSTPAAGVKLPRRAQPNRYPDFGRSLAPAFPSVRL